jgi:iron complex transport system substrate-binding protein
VSVRIVSLVPSATELVAELGLAGLLVGRSQECDWPPEVRELPVVAASRVDTASLDGAEIDAAVRDALAGGHSLYAVDAPLLERLAPGLILTQDMCAVCAVSSDQVATCAAGAEILSLDARTLAELDGTIERLAARLGVPARGRAITSRLHARLEAVRARTTGRRRPRVAVLEWLDPPFAPGHWVPEIVEIAGGDCVLGQIGADSYRIGWDDVRSCRPELVIAAPCGYDRDRAAREASLTVPDLGCPVVAVDANASWSRCTPRLADAAEELAALLHPASEAAREDVRS